MKKATSMEHLAEVLTSAKRVVLIFTADWCGDCQFIYPSLPELEKEFADFQFLQVDRDDFMPLAQKWDVFGIPSLLVFENGQEIGRFVDKNRKTKAEIGAFLARF